MMPSEKEREKTYILGELEKLASDQSYYLRNKTKTAEFIEKNEELLWKLHKVGFLEPEERKTISKTKNWMKKLGRMIK